MFNRYNKISTECWIFAISMIIVLTAVIRCFWVNEFVNNPDSYKRVIDSDDYVYSVNYELKRAERAQNEAVNNLFGLIGVDGNAIMELYGLSSSSYGLDEYLTSDYIRHYSSDLVIATMVPYHSFDQEFYREFAKDTIIPLVLRNQPSMSESDRNNIISRFANSNISSLKSLQFRSGDTNKTEFRNIYVIVSEVAAVGALIAFVIFILRCEVKLNGLTVSFFSIFMASLINMIWIAIERATVKGNGILMLKILFQKYYVLPIIVLSVVAVVFLALSITARVISNKNAD